MDYSYKLPNLEEIGFFHKNVHFIRNLMSLNHGYPDKCHKFYMTKVTILGAKCILYYEW